MCICHNAAKPIETWLVDETQKWNEYFPDWVKDSTLIQEYMIDGQTLVCKFGARTCVFVKNSFSAKHAFSLQAIFDFVSGIGAAARVQPLSTDTGGSPSKEQQDSDSEPEPKPQAHQIPQLSTAIGINSRFSLLHASICFISLALSAAAVGYRGPLLDLVMRHGWAVEMTVKSMG